MADTVNIRLLDAAFQIDALWIRRSRKSRGFPGLCEHKLFHLLLNDNSLASVVSFCGQPDQFLAKDSTGLLCISAELAHLLFMQLRSCGT